MKYNEKADEWKRLDEIAAEIGEYSAVDDIEKAIWEQDSHVFSESYEAKKQQILDSLDTEKRRTIMKNRTPYRKFIGIAASLAVVAGMSFAVYAASKGYSTQIKEDDHGIRSIEVETGEEQIQGYEMDAVPGYLPDGYEEWAEGKYSKGGEWAADGISIFAVPATQLEDLVSEEGIQEDADVREEVIAGTKALVVDHNNSDWYNSVTLLYEEEGYAVKVFGTAELPVSELIKVAENVECKVHLDKPIEYVQDDEAGEAEERYNDARNIYVRDESIADIGTEVRGADSEVSLTVNEINVIDSLQGYDTSKMADYEEYVKPQINEDGTIKNYDRVREIWDEHDRYSKEETSDVSRKLVEVKYSIKNYGDTQELSVPINMSYLKTAEDGQYDKQFVDGYSEDTEGNPGQLNSDIFPFYFGEAEDTEGIAKGFYIRTVESGETLECTVVYAVDEDMLDQAYIECNPEGLAYTWTDDNYTFVKITE